MDHVSSSLTFPSIDRAWIEKFLLTPAGRGFESLRAGQSKKEKHVLNSILLFIREINNKHTGDGPYFLCVVEMNAVLDLGE